MWRLVVAQTIEQARHAASLVQVSYAPELPILTMDDATKAKKPKKKQDESVQLHKGDVTPALSNQEIVQVYQTYSTPTETHNPIEMSGTIAAWEGDDKLTVWDATQFVKGVQSILSRTYGLKIENVRVICPFVGGAFGCKGAVWPHVLLAAMAAKVARVPVKFHLPRKTMFTGAGHRTPTRQTIALAATSQRKIAGHESCHRHAHFAGRRICRNLRRALDRGDVRERSDSSGRNRLSGKRRHADVSCARPANAPASMRSNARWMNCPISCRWIRWNFAWRTMLTIIRSRTFLSVRNI